MMHGTRSTSPQPETAPRDLAQGGDISQDQSAADNECECDDCDCPICEPGCC